MWRRPLAAALVVLVSNAIGLAHVWTNRSGGAEQTMTLTERELRLLPRETENTAMTLRLAWTDPFAREKTAGWFGAAKLAELGFDCSLPPTDANARMYQGQPPRQTYAALEFDGPAWQRYAEVLTQTLPKNEEERDAALAASQRDSHLVLIDVGNDPAALRQRYPDRSRVLVLPAVAGIQLVRKPDTTRHLAGYVSAVFPNELHVGREARSVLEPLTGGTSMSRGKLAGRPTQSLDAEPRYTVTVTWGRSFEPWITTVQLAVAR
jgi:hypothetical protein